MNELGIVKTENILGKEFRIFGTMNEPLFLAKDVAEWIDYAWKDAKQDHRDVSKMIQSVDEDEKLRGKLFLSGQNREAWFLTENGLYEVLMLSTKPIAKAFKKEVKKVLHSLRLNGGYIADQEKMTPEQIVANALVVAQKIIADKDKQLEAQKPKVAAFDNLVARDRFCNFRDGAVYLGIKQNELMDVLRSKYIYKNTVGEYRAYSEYAKYFTLRPFDKGCDKVGQQLMFNIHGLEYFRELLGKTA